MNEPGGLCWEDLRSTDPDAARALYSTVFRFTTQALEMSGPDYTTFSGRAGGAHRFETPFGPMAALQDPAGAAFWISEPAATEQPDRSG